MNKTPFFSLIIPCYNESRAIPNFLLEMQSFQRAYAQAFPELPFKVFFVDNNSTDDSAEQLLKFCQNNPNMKLETCLEPGYGAAIKHGFSKASSKYYAFTDLDCTYPLDAFLDCLKHVQKDAEIDMVMTNRMNEMSQMPFVRQFGNFLYQALTKLFFKSQLGDVCSGMRVLHQRKKAVLMETKNQGLGFSIELTAWALKEKWKIQTQDIQYRERVGVSKLSAFKDGFDFLWTLCRVKFLATK